MIWTRTLLALLLMLLMLATGLGAWAYANRGYPDVVYYQRSVVISAGGGLVSEPVTVALWVDPHHIRAVMRQAWASQDTDDIIREGRDFNDGTFSFLVPGSQPLTRRQSGSLALYCQELLAGGFPAVGAARLARALGPSSPVQFFGRPALRAATHGEDDPAMDWPLAPLRTVAWIDRRTHQPLQRQATFAGGSTVTDRIIIEQRLPPNTLPADFFDPPATQQGWWDRALGWVQDRMARR